jgi:hypothetical protein
MVRQKQKQIENLNGDISGVGDESVVESLTGSGGLVNCNNNRLIDVATPIDSTDGVNKAYVDGYGAILSDHALSHLSSGNDELDGYNIQINYIPTNYSVLNDLLGEHLASIDIILNDVGIQNLSQVLSIGNTSGGNNIILSNGDYLTSLEGASGIDLTITSGAGTAGDGGDIYINSGEGTTGGGDINIISGAGAYDYSKTSGADIQIQSEGGANFSGAIYLRSGDINAGWGGTISLTSGDAQSGATSHGGTIELIAGGYSAGYGGAIDIQSGTGASGQGGPIYIRTLAGGDITIRTNASGSGTGDILLNTNNGGDITLSAEIDGNIYFNTGTGTGEIYSYGLFSGDNKDNLTKTIVPPLSSSDGYAVYVLEKTWVLNSTDGYQIDWDITGLPYGTYSIEYDVVYNLTPYNDPPESEFNKHVGVWTKYNGGLIQNSNFNVHEMLTNVVNISNPISKYFLFYDEAPNNNTIRVHLTSSLSLEDTERVFIRGRMLVTNYNLAPNIIE